MKYLLIVALLVLAAIPIFSQITTNRSPSSSKECALCHYEWTEPFFTMRVGTAIADYPMEKEVSDERMCFSCHDGSVADSRFLLWGPHGENHKTGTLLQPGMNPPAALPLENGRITCMTCHSAHGTGDVDVNIIETSLFLRMPNDKSQLCISCHLDMTTGLNHPLKAMTQSQMLSFKPGPVKLADNNMVVCTSCHETHGAPEKNLLRASGVGMELCKNCHTDQFPANKPDRDDLATGHQVNLEVDDVNVKETVLRNSGRLGPDGELVCFSCHTLHKAKAPGLLNRSNNESAFCRDCHFEQDNIFNSRHNMTRAQGYKTLSGKTAMDVGVCSSCHGAHNWQQRLPSINADEMSKMCLSCHESGRVAKEKPIIWSKFNHYTGDIENEMQVMLSNPLMQSLPENTQKFLNKYFEYNAPRTMRTPSSVTCMTCHDIHKSEFGGKMFLREEASDGTLCLNCHQDQKGVADTSHGTAKLTQSCMSCHNVHNSDTKFLVRESAKDDGCTSCHTTNIKPEIDKYLKEPMPDSLTMRGFNHSTNIDNGTAFPLPMKQRNDGRFTCISCHNPHASQDNSNPMARNFLWLDANTDTMDKFCTVCHDDQKGVIVSDHAPAPNNIVLVNERTGRTAESCDTCHKVHNAEVEKFIYAVKGTYKDNDSFCTVCHSADSQAGYMAAKDKVVDAMQGHVIGALDKTPDVTEYLAMENGKYKIECFTCHDAHKNGPLYGTEGFFDSSFVKVLNPRDINLCITCHEGQRGVLKSGHFMEKFESNDPKVQMAKAGNDTCGTCHAIHNSRREFLMAGATAEERCMTCHSPGELSVRSIINSHKSEVILKDKNTANLPLENNKIVCGTCHEPHSPEKALMRLTADRTGDLCISCHETQQWVALSKHNMAISAVKDGVAVQKALDNSCIACHATHNYAQDAFFMWPHSISIGRDFTENACADCHKRGGLASDNVPKYMNHSRVLKMFPLQAQYRDMLRGFDGRMSEDGDISCSTCHDPHVWSTNQAKLTEATSGKKIKGDKSTSFLKGSIVEGFCDVCHDDAPERYEKFHDDKFRKDNSKRGLLNRIFN